MVSHVNMAHSQPLMSDNGPALMATFRLLNAYSKTNSVPSHDMGNFTQSIFEAVSGIEKTASSVASAKARAVHNQPIPVFTIVHKTDDAPLMDVVQEVVAATPVVVAPPVSVAQPKPQTVPVQPVKQVAFDFLPAEVKKASKVGRPPVPSNRVMVNGHPLPKNLKSIEDAISMSAIICLEDGRRVKDLGDHLKALGISPEQYCAKWDLSPDYPMQAPLQILQKSPIYEIDFVTGASRRIK